MLNIVCVKWGSKYGPEYVNRLCAMVARNLADRTPGRFICYTDDPTGLEPGVEIRFLPEDIKGWWNKLWLFSPGQFKPGDQVLYLDLDTLVIGALDEIAAWRGDFAILRDFYRRDGLQSSVMSWRSTEALASIWHSWDEASRPELDGGDQAWIEKCFAARWPALWQDLFPGSFVSYKVHCKPYPPEDARVVVFHGEPSPADCGVAWVEHIWNDKDFGGLHLELHHNTVLDTVRAQNAASAERGLPRLTSKWAHDGVVCIVGGGPSLTQTLPILRGYQERGAKIWALNGVYPWMLERGITPDAMAMLDARPENIRFLRMTSTRTIHYLASQCHPSVFGLLMDNAVVRFDLDVMGDCGTTVGTYAMCIAFVEGFRDIHLFGFDSSYRDDEDHAYPQDLNRGDRIIDVQAGDRTFRAAPWMAQQAKDFQSLARDMAQQDCTIAVHGTGLIPYIASEMAKA